MNETKTINVVRRVDDLGRIVIPREIRRRLDIKEGDALEVYANQDGEVVYKKYNPVPTLESVSKAYIESIADVRRTVVFVTDCSKVIASTSCEYLYECLIGKSLRDEIIDKIMKGFDSFSSEDISCYAITEDYDDESSFVVAPITNNYGSIVGSIIMLTGEVDTESEEWLVQIAAKTIGKQLL